MNDFTVVQLPYTYPDDDMTLVLRRTVEEMRAQGWTRAVGVVTSIEGHCLYAVFEKDATNDHICQESQSPPSQ